jgi:hypothetical protein
MDLAGSPAVTELCTLPTLALSTIATGTAEATSSSPSKAASARTAWTAWTAEAAARSTSTRGSAWDSAWSPGLSAHQAPGASRSTHQHAEVGLGILRQALAEAARDLEGLAAVLAIHRRHTRCPRFRSTYFVLQQRLKLIPAALRAAHASHALGHGGFLQLQRKIDLGGFRAIQFLSGRFKPEHTHFDRAVARGLRRECIAPALIGGRDDFPIANGGRDSCARYGLIRRLYEATLGIQAGTGGEKRKEKKTMKWQNPNASNSKDDRKAPAVTLLRHCKPLAASNIRRFGCAFSACVN